MGFLSFEFSLSCISCSAFRNKRINRGTVQSASAITAALLSEDEEDSDLSDEHVEEAAYEGELDNPRWQLYNAVRTCTNAQGEFAFLLILIYLLNFYLCVNAFVVFILNTV